MLKPFFFFLLLEQDLHLSTSSGYFSLVALIIRVRKVSNKGSIEGHGGRVQVKSLHRKIFKTGVR